MFRIKRLFVCKSVIILLFLFLAVVLSGQEERDFEMLYTDLQRPIYDMVYSGITGISEFGLVFAIPGMNGGVAYYSSSDSLEIYSVATNLGVVSVAPDDVNQRIFAAFGCGSNGDGLYSFNAYSHEFTIINWYLDPNFIKEIDDVYYFGYGYWSFGGLLYSEDGDSWSEISYFDGLCVTDIEKAAGAVLFASAGNFIYLKDDDNWMSYEVPVVINDIYVRNYPHNEEVYIACGNGTYSDAVYRVEYEEGEINGLTMINWFMEPYRLYEYEEMLVVGCLNNNGLYLVEPEEMSEPQEIGAELDFTDVYCFETYPIYTHNFIMGTDIGIYLVTNLGSGISEDICLPVLNLTNYPNPFNPSTRIEFTLAEDSEVELAVYDLKGRLVERLIDKEMSAGKQTVDWDGQNVSSGIYFCRLEADGKMISTKKMVLLK